MNMAEYKLMGTECPRTGEVHNWIQRDGTNVTLEEVVGDLLWLQEECERLREDIQHVRILHAIECAKKFWPDAAGGGDG